jgi:hypothetical protein
MWVVFAGYVAMVITLLFLLAEGRTSYESLPIPLLITGAAIGAWAEWRRIQRTGAEAVAEAGRSTDPEHERNRNWIRWILRVILAIGTIWLVSAGVHALGMSRDWSDWIAVATYFTLEAVAWGRLKRR